MKQNVEFLDTPEQKAKLHAALLALEGNKSPIMPALHEAQAIYGYLPFEVQKTISDKFQVPLAEIYGVVTFYSQFQLQPSGKNTVGVCLGTACYVKGSGDLFDRFKEILGVGDGETTSDGMFTLEGTRCIGCCGLAPVLTVNEDVHGKVVTSDVQEIIERYK